LFSIVNILEASSDVTNQQINILLPSVLCRELHSDGDSGITADTAVIPRDGDGYHGNTAGMGTVFTVIPW